MESTTNTVLKIAFDLSNGSTKNISLKDPKTGLTMSNVQTFATLIVSKNAIKVNNATTVSLSDAYIETTTRTELE